MYSHKIVEVLSVITVKKDPSLRVRSTSHTHVPEQSVNFHERSRFLRK